MDNNSLAHTRWDCTYHIVIIPKYRRKVMYKELRREIGEILRTLCGYKSVEIVSGSIGSDHIHMCVKIPPKQAVSEFMGYLKGKSALMIFDKHQEYKNIGNRHFWAKGYFVSTVGINKEILKEYIKHQEDADIIEDRVQP
jgi:putative transposase